MGFGVYHWATHNNTTKPQSLSMGADLGTKILPTRRFKFLRDLVTGYAHARAAWKTMLPSLHKASRALDIRVYALRNRIEDQSVMLKWIGSLSMLTDLGTKILPTRTFKFLRDLVTGYAHARAAGKTVLPSMVTTLSVMMAVQATKSRKPRL